jgi:mannose-6-phosphate isomerase-like protein (cupin superfamily)
VQDRLTVQRSIAKLGEGGELFATLFRHGSLEIEIYRPNGSDLQQPHTRDEVYVVISGSGYFVNGEVRRPFEAGEVLFVSAGTVHRFEDFSDDFATWVLFYGPEGGETSK